MAEQNISVTVKAGKNGKEYRNINLKDIDVGNSIVVEKMFVEGLKVAGKFGDVFSVGVKYNDELVSFWLNIKQNEAFKSVGDVGDKIKVTAKEDRYQNPKTKVTMLVKNFDFEKV
jgi:hypothetical protein